MNGPKGRGLCLFFCKAMQPEAFVLCNKWLRASERGSKVTQLGDICAVAEMPCGVRAARIFWETSVRFGGNRRKEAP